MFGHQAEPQQPINPPALPPSDDTARDIIPDGILDDPVITGSPAVAVPTTSPSPVLPPMPLIEARETDGIPAAPVAPPTAPVVPDPSLAAPAVSAFNPTDQLLDIKQQALQQLSPLIGHLEQSPEEKFRTTMMMIQASDNQDLVGAAYEAAQAITDEKARAQALLDIVNEINYFTQRQAK